MSAQTNTPAPSCSSCGEPDPLNPGDGTNDYVGVDVSWCRYRMEALPGRDRSGVRLRHPETGEIVAVIDGIGAGWAVQVHPGGAKLGTAGPDEELGDAVRRAEAAIAEMTRDEAIDLAEEMLNSDPETLAWNMEQDRRHRIEADRTTLCRHIDLALAEVYRAVRAHDGLVAAHDIEYAEAGSGDFVSFLIAARRALRAAQALNPVKDGAR